MSDRPLHSRAGSTWERIIRRAWLGLLALASLPCGLVAADTLTTFGGSSWLLMSSMNDSRQDHTSTLLPSGKLLIVGGRGNHGPIASCELYDPVRGTWSDAGSLATPRARHTATLLETGMVLIVGGETGTNGTVACASCELYDPLRQTWTTLPTQLGVARRRHTATKLQTGEVLVVGGTDATSLPIAICELFSVTTGSWRPTAVGLTHARVRHAATRLASGKVLVSGGSRDLAEQYTTTNLLSTCELYDPVTDTWSATKSLRTWRCDHAAILLPNGRVMTVGGNVPYRSGSGMIYDPKGCDLYDAATAGDFWAAAGALQASRIGHSTSLLPSGQILAVGGGATAEDPTSTPMATCELFTWSSTGGAWAASETLADTRRRHTATILPTGQLLLVGGCQRFDGSPLPTSELRSDTTTVMSDNVACLMNTRKVGHAAVLLPSGEVLACGGAASGQLLNAWEIYDPATNRWTPNPVGAGLVDARYQHTATLLRSGLVLIVGGRTLQNVQVLTCELFDPGSRTSRLTAGLPSGAVWHSANLLPSGEVLVITVTRCMLFDPVAETWRTLVDTEGTRVAHRANLLKSGQLLLSGGFNNGILSSCKLFDPTFETCQRTGPLNRPRGYHTSVLLPNGDPLVVGGMSSDSWYEDTAELYSVATQGWRLDPVGSNWQEGATTNLPSGVVLQTGEYSSEGTPNLGLYDPRSQTWRTTTHPSMFRSGFSATLLATNQLLLGGGYEYPNATNAGNQYLDDAPLFSQQVESTRAAVLDSVTVDHERLTCRGHGFHPAFATSGDGTGSSPSNIPCVQWQSQDGDRAYWLEPVGGFSDGAVTVQCPPDCGPGWIRVWVNGIPSSGRYALLSRPTVGLASSSASISDDGGAILTVSIDRPYLVPVIARLATSGSAVEGSDFTLGAATATIPPGATTTTISVTGRPGTPGDQALTVALADIRNADDGSVPVRIDIRSSNHAPVLITPGNDLPAVVGTSAASQISIAELINGKASDSDPGAALGIAVIGVSGAGGAVPGKGWQFTQDIGAHWHPIAADITSGAALLLTDSGLVQIRYVPVEQVTEEPTITYRAWDRTSGTAGAAFDITVTGSGGSTAFSSTQGVSRLTVSAFGPPVVTVSPGTITWNEVAGVPVRCDNAVTCTDLDSPTLGGGNIVIAITPGRPGDRLDYDGTLTNGTVLRIGTELVLAGQTSLGTITGGQDGTALSIALTAATTPALAQTILRGLTFTNVGGNPAAAPTTPEDRTVTVTVNDGAATSTAKEWIVTVVPVDSPPVVEPLTLAVVPGLSATGQLVAHDPEGGVLTFQLLAEQTKGEVAVDAAGLVSYRNTVLDGQDDSFRVTVSAGGQSATGTVTVRLAAEAGDARFTSVPPLLWRAGVIFSYTPSVSGLGAAPVFRLQPGLQDATSRAAIAATNTFSTQTGTVTFTLPSVPAGGYVRFGIVAVDPVTQASAFQPVLLKILLAGDG